MKTKYRYGSCKPGPQCTSQGWEYSGAGYPSFNPSKASPHSRGGAGAGEAPVISPALARARLSPGDLLASSRPAAAIWVGGKREAGATLSQRLQNQGHKQSFQEHYKYKERGSWNSLGGGKFGGQKPP